MSTSSDDEMEENPTVISQIEDFHTFNINYEETKKTYKTRPYLDKYEKTAVISERAQQLANGGQPLLKNPESYNTVYEIALEELRQKKIPYIIHRPSANGSEYWKLADLKIL
jgi:DNA-directed RNA polymerase subunit K/omega